MVSNGVHQAEGLGPWVGRDLMPPPQGASEERVYPAGKVGSHGDGLSMAVHSPAKSGKGTSEVLPY